ncbi:MAG TPA: GH116 family glycosyl hydrolase [Phycisphaerales bacterium]|nr:GH116 family glycosyl hydrolase [Phycisphaerales bacterium]
MTLTRREFSLSTSLAAAGWLYTAALPMRAIAGPFSRADQGDFPIPADKKLDRGWVESLTRRGEATVYRSKLDELAYIGMPIGGICAGHVYLGGDGKLWHWDIFNQPAAPTWNDSQGPHYARPVTQASPMQQGFALRIQWSGGVSTRSFDINGWSDIEFRGQYPIGLVEYKEPGIPVEASLEAFSPFCPLDADDSGLPATCMNFTVRNTSAEMVTVAVGGWLENAVLGYSDKDFDVARRTHARIDGSRAVRIDCTGGLDENAAKVRAGQDRPEIIFDRFERETYAPWTTTGKAFGQGPRRIDSLPGYMGPVRGEGERVVNSHHTQGGEDVGKADTYIGTLTSPEFPIERRFISFRMGGGRHAGQTCINILVDGAPVRTVTGRDSNVMDLHNIDVLEFAGRTARIQVVDAWSGGWGQVSIDDVVFCDSPRKDLGLIDQQPDYGTLSMAMILARDTDPASLVVESGLEPASLPGALFDRAVPRQSSARPIGGVAQRLSLKPGESRTFRFVIAWHFATPWRDHVAFLEHGSSLKHHYSTRFKSAMDVVDHVIEHEDRLSTATRTWHRAWYDSTLPWWFLNRTIASASALATSTCLRFDNNRFYGWEGTYCCAGTCTHVWSYAHSVGRLFPGLERSAREMADYGVAFHDDTGAMDYRAEGHRIVAHDGQCGTILRTYREHQMSPDNAFLARVWPRVKKAAQCIIKGDRNSDGLLEGDQYNTLDTVWFGEMAWMSSYYIAMLRAAAQMATEMGDESFAGQCTRLAESGSKLLVERLFNGEYFIHHPDPAHPEANNTNDGCHSDQLMGQAWALQVGLGRIVPKEHAVSALKSLWKYNFTPDIGPYREAIKGTVKGGRWYAMPGEGGMIVCTFPKGGADRCVGKGNDAWAAGYFNESWTGFEHQVAGHMLFEGLVTEAMAIEKMMEDRHHARLRNPWNEVECSSHYARGMSSHGAFIAACGYEYHGPRGFIAFAPRVSPDDFRAAFTAAQGWGSFSQKRTDHTMRGEIAVAHGVLRLTSAALTPRRPASRVHAILSGKPVEASLRMSGERAEISFGSEILVPAGTSLVIELA